MKRKRLTLRQAIILLLVGAVVGYPSWVAFKASQWGNIPGLVGVGLIIAAVSLISGIIALLVIVVRAYASMVGITKT
jgi:hypothetical protein